MMTVVYKPMRRRRWMRIEAGNAPPTWKTFPMHDKGTAGSAKPGRGGRRKRKRRAAGARAFNAYSRAHRLSKATGVALPRRWLAIFRRACRLLPVSGADVSDLGRRERRRRAKLRRRKDKRRVEALAKLFAPAGRWPELAKNWAFRRHTLERATGPGLDRLAILYGVTRTHVA